MESKVYNVKIVTDGSGFYINPQKLDITKETDEIKNTEKYWDCECENDFIHPKTQSLCNICRALAEEQPNSRINEVLMFGFPL